MNGPSVSIIIAAKDAEKTIEKCIGSILGLDYKDYELVIVNDGSADRTAEILKKYGQKIKIITNPFPLGPSESRNLAAREAQSEYLVFIDADCMVKKDWICQLLEGFKAYPFAAACGGSQRLPDDASNFQKKTFLFMKKVGFITEYVKSGSEIKEVKHNPSCNVMYRREVLLKENGFLKGLWPGEDVELDYRLKKKGYNLVFNPGAVVYHYRQEGLKPFLKMMYRYGYAQGFLVRRHGLFRKLHFLPLFTICAVIFLFYAFSKSLFLGLGLISASLLFILGYFVFDFSIFILAVLGSLFWHVGFLSGLLINK